MTSRDLATIVATVDVPAGVSPSDLRAAVADALDRLGARPVDSGWAPDADTIADACGVDSVTVVEVAPARV